MSILKKTEQRKEAREREGESERCIVSKTSLYLFMITQFRKQKLRNFKQKTYLLQMKLSTLKIFGMEI